MTRRRSLLLAIASGLFGFLVWGYDDLFTQMQMSGTSLHHILQICEFIILCPGLAVMVFVVLEYIKVSQQELKRAREKARQQKLIALGKMAAGLAHEVRNPLHNIHLLVEEAREEAVTEAKLDRIVANIRRIDHAVGLVYRLARPRSSGAGEETTDLALAVGAAVSDQRLSTPATAISWTQPETEAIVAAVLDDVRIALDNLFRNAVTAASEHAGMVAVSLRRDGAFFELLVTNPGQLPVWLAHGEDEALLGSTKPGGLGLGLSISRQLIADGGGELTIIQQGRMVEARLRLPVAA